MLMFPKKFQCFHKRLNIRNFLVIRLWGVDMSKNLYWSLASTTTLWRTDSGLSHNLWFCKNKDVLIEHETFLFNIDAIFICFAFCKNSIWKWKFKLIKGHVLHAEHLRIIYAGTSRSRAGESAPAPASTKTIGLVA